MNQASTLKNQSITHDFLLLNLQRLMKKSGLNEADLSRKTGIPQATLHKILSGKTEDPRASTLKTLSDFFNLSIDELMFGSLKINHQAIQTPAIDVQSVPLISWKECTDAKLFTQKLNAKNWEKWAVSNFFSIHGYALSSKPSMEPRFPKGTVLFIDPNASVQDGDFVVVLYQATEEATLRELSIDGPTRLLLPINDHAEPTQWDNDIKLLGVLVRSSFQY
ncbi:MAG: helix-turn-helix domain-containing protein [Coxiellaceae bacterium]|nr:helix-turn-helix domain-containing protein [Coxiellaceae bacterium]